MKNSPLGINLNCHFHLNEGVHKSVSFLQVNASVKKIEM